MKNVIMIVGCPASGKSKLSESYISRGYIHLNRDKLQKQQNRAVKTIELLPFMDKELSARRDIILDNTFATAESRKPFIEAAKRQCADISCIVMDTTVEDAQINALTRMHDRYGKVFFTEKDIKEADLDDPNIFPAAVLFQYQKKYEKPTAEEGFSSVDKFHFERKPRGYSNRALLLDYDGTLRTVTGPMKFPSTPDEFEIMPGRKKILESYLKQNYRLLGVSNQSGIGKKQITEKQAIDCFEATNDRLGVDIEYHYCPHTVPPVSCYCRKPQSGMGVMLIEKYKLDPSSTIMVGDMTTDKTFAKRLGFPYCDQQEFFK